MTTIEMINNPKAAWTWAMEWVETAKTNKTAAVKMISTISETIKDVFCTDGLWAPGAEYIHEMLNEAAEMAAHS